ncbi:LysR substrate-binding domain-containing protein [Kordiimonas aestuarii]|uniref:LysR substrate-binding domain-containing protein n=1 Tax=Kordiimonas aestuarii TaxID=1005925 RepID=UPI0021D29B5C|nr:LysR substrate-binding domain-containing protein [Kordiimonas aestuarii]
MKTLPALTTIRAFEAAARHLSFKAAAEEIGVTPTAISHQIRLLEDTLKLKLFVRHPRQVSLSIAGQGLFQKAQEALSLIAEGIEDITANRAIRPLTLTTTSAFMTLWVLPRLTEFQATETAVPLSLHASEDVVPLKAGIADMAVRYGNGHYGELEASLLFKDSFAPLCSPRLEIRSVADLKATMLLRSRWRNPDNKTPTWEAWFQKADLSEKHSPHEMSFGDDLHAAQAAIAGQGIAILSVKMMAREIKSGLLVQPFTKVLDGHEHCFVYDKNHPDRKRIEQVRSWLLAATAPLRN